MTPRVTPDRLFCGDRRSGRTIPSRSGAIRANYAMIAGRKCIGRYTFKSQPKPIGPAPRCIYIFIRRWQPFVNPFVALMADQLPERAPHARHNSPSF